MFPGWGTGKHLSAIDFLFVSGEMLPQVFFGGVIGNDWPEFCPR